MSLLDTIKNDIDSVFLDVNGFAQLAVYSFGNYNKQCPVVVKNNVNIIGDYGQTSETVTTISMSSGIDIEIGGEFSLANYESYIVDSIISNNGYIQVVSVVKQ